MEYSVKFYLIWGLFLVKVFPDSTTEEIKNIIRRFMDGVVERRIVLEPWDVEKEKMNKPFHFALAPELVWKGSKFERSLVTVMGQTGWEQIGRIIAQENHGHAENGRMTTGEISQGKLTQIQTILDELEHKSKNNNRTPNWYHELSEVLARNDGDLTTVSVISDLYVYNPDTEMHYYIELKSPKPNSDQTKISKEKMLKIEALFDGSDLHNVYYALPFNPYGSRDKYAHPHPKRWFDMIQDDVVVMGKELWDLLGGEGTYEYLLKVFEEVGSEYRPRINRDYFGLDD